MLDPNAGRLGNNYYMHVYDLSLTIPRPFNFRLTVKKPAGWHWAALSEVFEDETLFTAIRLSGSRLVGLALSAADGQVTATVESRHKLDETDRHELVRRLRFGLGADEDLEGFYALDDGDELVRQLRDDLYGMRVGRADDVFERALLAICLQMAPMKRSNEMMGCLVERYGDGITIDGRRIVFWPSAETVARTPVTDLAANCKLGYRAKFIKGVAEAVAAGFPGILELAKLSDTEALAQLKTLPGIGHYSAQIISPHIGFPLDVWSARIFYEIMFGSTPSRPRRMIREVEQEARKRWGDYRWHVFVYVLHDLPALAERYAISKPV